MNKHDYYIRSRDKVKKPCSFCGNEITGKNRTLYCSELCNMRARTKIYMPSTQLEGEEVDNIQIVTNRARRPFINNLPIPYEDIED